MPTAEMAMRAMQIANRDIQNARSVADVDKAIESLRANSQIATLRRSDEVSGSRNTVPSRGW
jgi:hypothetical protein